ncbi:hypothetical protein Pcinc_039988 [Petrolisthes cinctipes]|uniref:Uncharacterized protein n=1 Tax=Petrolisthes cinctipes TaxID=88211 RepID=A0AAE1BQ36_PETCI|nr:hypothetical protein Pcinc_039988 [Petrolisthes cinctipes]
MAATMSPPPHDVCKAIEQLAPPSLAKAGSTEENTSVWYWFVSGWVVWSLLVVMVLHVYKEWTPEEPIGVSSLQCRQVLME